MENDTKTQREFSNGEGAKGKGNGGGTPKPKGKWRRHQSIQRTVGGGHGGGNGEFGGSQSPTEPKGESQKQQKTRGDPKRERDGGVPGDLRDTE